MMINWFKYDPKVVSIAWTQVFLLKYILENKHIAGLTAGGS